MADKVQTYVDPKTMIVRPIGEDAEENAIDNAVNDLTSSTHFEGADERIMRTLVREANGQSPQQAQLAEGITGLDYNLGLARDNRLQVLRQELIKSQTLSHWLTATALMTEYQHVPKVPEGVKLFVTAMPKYISDALPGLMGRGVSNRDRRELKENQKQQAETAFNQDADKNVRIIPDDLPDAPEVPIGVIVKKGSG